MIAFRFVVCTRARRATHARSNPGPFACVRLPFGCHFLCEASPGCYDDDDDEEDDDNNKTRSSSSIGLAGVLRSQKNDQAQHNNKKKRRDEMAGEL